MNRDLILIALSLFTWGLGESAYFPLIPLYLQKLDANPFQIGAIIGGFSLVGSLSYLPGGFLADRIGRRPVVIIGWVISVVATFFMAIATRLEFFIPSYLFYGFTVFVTPPLNSYITEARGKLSTGRALTLTSAFYSLGAIIGPLFGGKIADTFGYRRLFFIALGIFIVSTAIISFIHSQPLDIKSKEDRSNRLLANHKYLMFLGVLFFATFAMYLPQPLASNYLQNQQKLNLTQIGQLYSINALGIVILNLVLGRLDTRVGFLLGQAAVGIFSLLLWQFTGIHWYLAAFFLLGGFRAARMLAMAQVQTLITPSIMGAAYGLAETVNAIAMILSPLLAGFLYDRNPSWLFSWSLFGIILSFILTSMVTKPHKLHISSE